MAIEGRVRDFAEDSRIFFSILRNHGRSAAKREQAEFRRDFKTPLRATADSSGQILGMLVWGAKVELDAPISADDFTAVTSNGVQGFVETGHLVEIAYVDRPQQIDEDDDLKADLTVNRAGDKAELLWGDMVQIVRRDGNKARVRARGRMGTISTSALTHTPLLECYFIDVGQGDGVLVRFPDGRHMLIDGGLGRRMQQTGKNAADFVDWKFFADYGDWSIDLDWMIASHSDADHYGGLHDLIDPDPGAREELDTLAVKIGAFGHPGLSRFPNSKQDPTDNDGLGPSKPLGGHTVFTELLGDRADATARTDGSAQHQISGWWEDFVVDLLANDPSTEFSLVALDQAQASEPLLPVLDTFAGPDGSNCVVKVLGPATIDDGGSPVLPDLGKKSINTNGHSVCLRLDYGAARILMTGDLNTASMNWLTHAYRDNLDPWKCDVAKACHHGSHDVSFKFLKAINAAATVISSGDNEGHAHPRPEIVAASALSGREKLSDDGDRVITPLIYMTEIERSVMLSEISRIEIANLGSAGNQAVVLGKPVSEFSGREFFTDADWEAFDDLDDPSDSQKSAFARAVEKRERARLEALEQSAAMNATSATAYGRRPTGVVGVEYDRKSVKRLRMMESNVYGLVNVRTDGELIMCASKRDSGDRWTIHWFDADFGGD